MFRSLGRGTSDGKVDDDAVAPALRPLHLKEPDEPQERVEEARARQEDQDNVGPADERAVLPQGRCGRAGAGGEEEGVILKRRKLI
jgi:hypothetical protein